MTHARYVLGPPTRPNITHDNGFLDKFARRAPINSDYVDYAYWTAKLELAEAGQNVAFLPHNDIPDGLAAYRHFLQGNGRTRRFSYDRYLKNDESGRHTLVNIIREVKGAAIQLYCDKFVGKDTEFEFTGSALAAGSASRYFPYPSTENWQKAIGAHNFWLSGIARVQGAGKSALDIEYEVDFTIHVEDMYNFNPGAADIATGIPDDANGKFELTGLAQQYLNVSTTSRNVKWLSNHVGALEQVSGAGSRIRKPQDNRRARNRT